jgi:hypothetical protein
MQLPSFVPSQTFFNQPEPGAVSQVEPIPILWREFASNKCDSGVLYDTGFRVNVHEVIWDKYSNELKAYLAAAEIPVVFHDDTEFAAYYYEARRYIYHYPRSHRSMRAILGNYKTGSVGEKDFYRRVVPILLILGALMDEIDIKDKYHPDNHGSRIFRYCFTQMFDGTDLKVCNMRRYDFRHVQRALYCAHKYNHACFKPMLGITFMGLIVHYTGPHIGTDSEARIIVEYPPHMKRWEWGFGDGAFEEAPQIMVKVQQPDGGVLSKEEVGWNTLFNYWRARVEHLMSDLKKPNMFSGVFRGSFPLFKSCLDLHIHSMNINRRLRLPRYMTCGPWPHWPVPEKYRHLYG